MKGAFAIGIIAFSILIYFIITIGFSFGKEDLTLDYYNAMALVKAVLAAGDIVAIAIIALKKD